MHYRLTCTLEPHNLIQHLHLIQTAGHGPSAGGGALSSAQPYTPHQSLTGFESLVLDYRVQWPLSIVLSRRAVTKYQLLSRMLFFSKYVEVSFHFRCGSTSYIVIICVDILNFCLVDENIGQLERAPDNQVTKCSGSDGRLLLFATAHVAFSAELRVLHDCGGNQTSRPRDAG